LYRKWRPADFDDVVDQKHIVQTLKYSVATGNIAHAYLFCGTRGTGKTSLAKIFAKAINCPNQKDGNPCNACEICLGITDGSIMDVAEIDAASNNSVDNIRRITDEVVFLPAITKYKVYIIDEVHMLSMGAFNALLKTLEEPPAHVVFMLATTEVHRIPATITSRCQRFDFRRISLNAITERLRKVATEEDIDVDQGALHEMAVQSDGALRDALSLLDQSQMAITGTITRTSVRELIGVVDTGFIGRLAGSLAEADAAAVLQAVDTVVMEGKDIVRFTADLAGYYRNLMICKSCSEPGNLLLATPEEISQMQTLAARYEQPEIVAIIKALSKLLADLKWITNPRTLLEVTLLSLAGTRRQPFGATGTASGNFAVRSAAPSAPVPAPVAPVAATPPPAVIPPVAPASAQDSPKPAPPSPVPAESEKPDPPVIPAELLEPVQKPAATGATSPLEQLTPAPEPPQAAQLDGSSPLWTRTLENLLDEDALIYMFAKTAYVSGTETAPVLSFTTEQQENYNILTGQRGNRPLLEALRKANGGKEIDVQLRIFDAAEPPDPASSGGRQGTVAPEHEWVNRVINSARNLGIKIQVDPRIQPNDDDY
jgi:DNA polymerase-3 subunit gamma/tau